MVLLVVTFSHLHLREVHHLEAFRIPHSRMQIVMATISVCIITTRIMYILYPINVSTRSMSFSIIIINSSSSNLLKEHQRHSRLFNWTINGNFSIHFCNMPLWKYKGEMVWFIKIFHTLYSLVRCLTWLDFNNSQWTIITWTIKSEMTAFILFMREEKLKGHQDEKMFSINSLK